MAITPLNPTLDGRFAAESIDSGSWAAVYGQGSADNLNTTATTAAIYAQQSSPGDFFVALFGMVFDPASIPTNHVVSGVSLRVTRSASGGTDATVDYRPVLFLPTSYTSLASSDYAAAKWTTRLSATVLALADFNAGDKTWTFDAAGIAAVQAAVTAGLKIGIGIVPSYHDDNSAPAAGRTGTITICTNDHATEANRPLLTVTHAAAVTTRLRSSQQFLRPTTR